jgi:hypothetical protein
MSDYEYNKELYDSLCIFYSVLFSKPLDFLWKICYTMCVIK